MTDKKHHNLYYIFLEDKKSHTLNKGVAEELFKKALLKAQGVK